MGVTSVALKLPVAVLRCLNAGFSRSGVRRATIPAQVSAAGVSKVD